MLSRKSGIGLRADLAFDEIRRDNDGASRAGRPAFGGPVLNYSGDARRELAIESRREKNTRREHRAGRLVDVSAGPVFRPATILASTERDGFMRQASEAISHLAVYSASR